MPTPTLAIVGMDLHYPCLAMGTVQLLCSSVHFIIPIHYPLLLLSILCCPYCHLLCVLIVCCVSLLSIVHPHHLLCILVVCCPIHPYSPLLSHSCWGVVGWSRCKTSMQMQHYNHWHTSNDVPVHIAAT